METQKNIADTPAYYVTLCVISLVSCTKIVLGQDYMCNKGNNFTTVNEPNHEEDGVILQQMRKASQQWMLTAVTSAGNAFFILQISALKTNSIADSNAAC